MLCLIFLPYLLGDFHSYAHMRSSCIIECYYATQQAPGIHDILGTRHYIKPFRLQYAVYPLCDGIVGRLVILGHAYAGSQILEIVHILVAAILNAPVGVVDELGQLIVPGIIHGFTQCGKRMHCMQRFRELPAYDLMGIGISDQMKIAYATLRLYVGDVCHEQTTGSIGDEILYQVLPSVEMMIGIRCMALLHRLEH